MTPARSPTRWSRRADLIHRVEHGKREPIVAGCWVVVADPDCERPLALAIVSSGPEYVHQDGYAIDEIWTLHTGEMRARADLTVLDLAGILEEGTRLLSAIRGGRRIHGQDDVAILRVHRAACLARVVDQSAAPLGSDARDQVEALISIDVAIAEIEHAWRDLISVRLPNLARALATAGMLELGRSPDWEPNTKSIAHPAWAKKE